MCQYVTDRGEVLLDTGRRSWKVEDQGRPDRASHTPRETAQRTDRPHRFTEAGRLTLEDEAGSLREFDHSGRSRCHRW